MSAALWAARSACFTNTVLETRFSDTDKELKCLDDRWVQKPLPTHSCATRNFHGSRCSEKHAGTRRPPELVAACKFRSTIFRKQNRTTFRVASRGAPLLMRRNAIHRGYPLHNHVAPRRLPAEITAMTEYGGIAIRYLKDGSSDV